MKKLLFLTPVICLLFVSCKKNDLTVDGKPASDATNDIVRVDTKAGANYKISVAKYNSIGPSDPEVLYNNANQSSASAFEYSFKSTAGFVIAVEVYAQNGTFAACDIYYKGLKVPVSLEAINQSQGQMPSHINITYITGATNPPQ